ncbi:hypothetical protein [Dysgonomonas macrotermitis]|uniref:C1q domain-containing protein n=1 Tax=Dysgonomonas macrotermitis TaxID=1346286 RepID=A0A1M5JUW4_9BACT|nr:hypothetical protein [Dysgonomonas macrotermitis]SHG44346.1 hypothetical protein SAMN05444362_1296 [Dysgonomonas macrotermitis]
MKKGLFSALIAFMSITLSAYSQVGINTEAPITALDINGDLRIVTVPTNTTSQNVLVLGTNNVVSQNTMANLMSGASNLRSFVRGTSSTTINLISLTTDILTTGWFKIAMPVENFDYNTNATTRPNGDYNTSTYEFTAPVTGLYEIFVQFKTSSVVSASEVGVGIFKRNSGATAFTLIAEETFLSVNVSVLTINLDVSPPTRKTQTLVQLNAGDSIIFGAKVPLVSVTLVGGTSTYFTINQVR